VRRDVLFGFRRDKNSYVRRILFWGGLLFVITGLSVWQQKQLLPYLDIKEVTFFPQGLALCFYGRIFFAQGVHLFRKRYLSVGSGFNEYDRKNSHVHIFRWGSPARYRRLEFFYSFDELEFLCIKKGRPTIKSTDLYLFTKHGKSLILTQTGEIEDLSIYATESFNTTLAQTLIIPLEDYNYLLILPISILWYQKQE
jgi:hypothetical protein